MPPDAPVTRWWLVRHAPVPVVGRIIYGQLDVACDTDDLGAFRALAARLPRPDVALITQLSRTRRTFEALKAGGAELPDARVEPDLAEQDFGTWEGRTWADLRTEDADNVSRFWANPLVEPTPGGESFVDMVARVQAAIGRWTDAQPGADILAICHAGAIRAALCAFIDLPVARAMSVTIDPLAVTRLDHTPDHWAGDWTAQYINRDPRGLPGQDRDPDQRG